MVESHKLTKNQDIYLIALSCGADHRTRRDLEYVARRHQLAVLSVDVRGARASLQ
jgi:hypothetical protein